MFRFSCLIYVNFESELLDSTEEFLDILESLLDEAMKDLREREGQC